MTTSSSEDSSESPEEWRARLQDRESSVLLMREQLEEQHAVSDRLEGLIARTNREIVKLRERIENVKSIPPIPTPTPTAPPATVPSTAVLPASAIHATALPATAPPATAPPAPRHVLASPIVAQRRSQGVGTKNDSKKRSDRDALPARRSSRRGSEKEEEVQDTGRPAQRTKYVEVSVQLIVKFGDRLLQLSVKPSDSTGQIKDKISDMVRLPRSKLVLKYRKRSTYIFLGDYISEGGKSIAGDSYPLHRFGVEPKNMIDGHIELFYESE